MVNRFEKWIFRQNNVEIEKSLVLGTLNGGDLLKIGADSITSITPDDSVGVGVNVIPVGTTIINVGAVINDANDFVVLPALASTPNGTVITLIGNAGANFEVRTPATSAEEINSEDCDGTKEYLFTDTQIHRFTKITTAIGWMAQGFTAIGAVAAAVVPD